MATIMEGSIWNLTEAAADRMAANGLIVRCVSMHCNAETVEEPIYHIDTFHAPDWFGVGSLAEAIKAAEAHVEASEESVEDNSD